MTENMEDLNNILMNATTTWEKKVITAFTITTLIICMDRNHNYAWHNKTYSSITKRHFH